MAYRWKPSKAKRVEFAQTMNTIDEFCREHGITRSSSSDSYYFMVKGQSYRVSNHTIESSNRAAYDDFGNQKRELYHPAGREDNTVYITASKTRIIDIYNDIVDGYQLDKRGYRV